MSFPWSFYRHQWASIPPAPKGPLLKGKTVVITGANSGVGLAATHQLAALSPARLILAVRNLDATQPIVETLKRKHPESVIEAWALDLADSASILGFADKAKELSSIDVLINNAGMNPNFAEGPFVSTKEGYERTIFTNAIAPLLLFLLLRPLLKSSDGFKPKAIFTGSDSHAFAVTTPFASPSILETFNDPQKYHNPTRYFQSKLLLHMITRSLICDFPDIDIINVHPGLCRTNLGREFKLGITDIFFILEFLINSRPASQGGRGLTLAAVSKTGSHDYWTEGQPAFSESIFLASGEGVHATRQWYEEALAECDKLAKRPLLQ